MPLKRIHRQLFVIFAILAVATLPFSIKWCSGAIILLTLNWIIEGNLKEKWQIIKQQKLIWVFSGFYILHLAGMLITENVDNGFFDLEKKLSLFILPIIIGTTPRLSAREVKIILNTFIVTCLAAIIVSLVFILISGSEIADPEHLNFDYLNKDKFRESVSGPANIWNLISYAGFGSFIHLHPTYFSLYVAFAITLLVNQCKSKFRSYQPIKKLIAVSALLILLVALIFLSSRIVIASFTLLCLFSLGHYFVSSQKYLQGALYSVAFISVIILLVYVNPVTRFRVIQEPLNTGFKYPESDDYWNSWNLRLLQWKSSFNIIKSHWLIGVGTGDTQEYLDAEYKKVGLGIFQANFNAHNQYLQTAMDLGLLGLTWLLVAFSWPLLKSWKRNNTIFLSFIFLFGMCCLSESMLEVQKGVVFYSFFNSLLVFHVFNLNPEKYA